MADQDDLEDALQRLRKLEAQQSEGSSLIAQSIPVWQEKFRTFVGSLVALLYAGVIAIIMIYLFVSADVCEDVFTRMMDVLKIGVIPIVTLVLGFYFAQAKS